MARLGASQRAGTSQKGAWRHLFIPYMVIKGASRRLEAPFHTIYGHKRCLQVPGGTFLGGSCSLGGSHSRHAFNTKVIISNRFILVANKNYGFVALFYFSYNFKKRIPIIL